jgi:multidrug transporter EmrE-like cation transporter
MTWAILLAASAVEILMGLSLKYADGWTRPVPSVLARLAQPVISVHEQRFDLIRSFGCYPAANMC